MKSRKNIISLLVVGMSLLGLAGTVCGQSIKDAIKFYEQGQQAYQQGNYQEALNYFQKSLVIDKNLGHQQGIIADLNQIGHVYKAQRAYDQALKSYMETLSLLKQSESATEIANILYNIGTVYYEQGNFVQALESYEEALLIKRKLEMSKDIVTILNNIGMVYYAQKNSAQALKFYKEALSIARQLEMPKDIASILNNIGTVYYAMEKDYARALQSHKESLSIWRKLNIPYGIAASLNNIAVVYNEQKDYEVALEFYEQSLTIYQELKDLQNVSNILNNIGTVYHEQKNLARALEYNEKSLAIRRELKIPNAVAQSLNNIEALSLELFQQGKQAYQRGQFQDALVYFKQSLEIDKKLQNQRGIADNLNYIGLVYDAQMNFALALKYYEQSLTIWKQLNIPKDIANSLNNIGIVYGSLANYTLALDYLKQALAIRRQLNIQEGMANSLNNIGAVYHDQGNFALALESYEKALAIQRQLNIPEAIARSLNNIGAVYLSLGNYAQALKFFEDALAINRQLKIPQEVAANLSNIASTYLGLQQYQNAEQMFYEAAVEYEKIGFFDASNTGLVEVYLATGKYQEAMKLLAKITPHWDEPLSYHIEFQTRNGLALQGLKDFKNSSYALLKAVTLTEELRQKATDRTGFLGAGSVKGRIRAYHGLVTSLAERWLQGEKNDDTFAAYGSNLAANAFYFAEATKARTLLEAMAESGRRTQKLELPDKLRADEQNLLNQLAAIERNWETQYKNGEEAFKNWMAQRDELKQQFDALLVRIRKEYPAYAMLYYPKPLPPEELKLNKNEALLEYAIGDQATYLFLVEQGGVKKLFKIAIGKEELEKQVTALLRPLQSPQGKLMNEFSPTLAKQLYDLLLRDALDGLPADTRLIIVPDGLLGTLPFEALVTNVGKNFTDSQYVGDLYPISYAQSATVLTLTRKLTPSQATRPLFALGDPFYNKDDPRYLAYKAGKPQPTLVASAENQGRGSFQSLASRMEWGKTSLDYPPLAETNDEVRAIAKQFKTTPEPPDVLLNIAANETTFRQSPLKKYRLLHFATHADLPGYVQGINEPFILLGQVENAKEDDGFLRMTEVLDLRLDAELVTLSACVTGRGEVMDGEGVVNFARAFQYAGARNVVVSLWELASEPAVEYMQLFYDYIKQPGVSKADALRKAKQEMKKKYPNPFYWSVLIIHGEGSIGEDSTPAPVIAPTEVSTPVKKAFIHNAQGIRLRSAPTAQGSSVLARLAYGTEVEVLAESRSSIDPQYKYYQVRTASGQIGWLFAGDNDDWLSETPPPEIPSRIMYVNTLNANFRSAPLVDSATSMDVLPQGTAVEVLTCEATWCNVKVQDGRTGWMSLDVLSVRNSSGIE